MSAEAPQAWSPEDKARQAREARRALTGEFVDRTKVLPEAISGYIQQAVVDGNFNELHRILKSLEADVERLEGNYQQSWKDLGPDK